MNRQELDSIWSRYRGQWVAFTYDLTVLTASRELDLLMGKAQELDPANPPIVAKMHKSRRGVLTVMIGPDETGTPQVKFHPKATDTDIIELTAEYASHMINAYLQRVRRWARKNGHPIGLRGRIPSKVEAAYLEAYPGDWPLSALHREPSKAQEP